MEVLNTGPGGAMLRISRRALMGEFLLIGTLAYSQVAHTESADNSWIPSLEEMKMQYDKLKLNKGI